MRRIPTYLATILFVIVLSLALGFLLVPLSTTESLAQTAPLTATNTSVPRTSTPSGSLTTRPTVTSTSTSPGKQSFYRAINLNGPATTIDGNAWEGTNAPNTVVNGNTFCDQNVPLIPATDANRAAMIRCSAWSSAPTAVIQSVPNGTYAVYLYVWEDNAPETFDIFLNGRAVVSNYVSGPAGTWRKLGPWPITLNTGTITLFSVGGNANFSGVEVWRTEGAASPPAQPAPAQAPALQRTVDPAAFLQTQGKDLVYKGQKAILKGTNFDSVGAFGANIGSANMNDIQFIEADYADLSAAGANHVRFGVSFIWYQRNPTQFFEKMDQQVAWARKHNIWITFVVFTTPGNCYEGYANSCPFWTNPAEHQELRDFWVAMAQRYRAEPAVAGYDLLNEPTPPAGCEQWFPIAGQIRDAVAAVAPHQLVFVASCMGPESLELPSLPRGQNIVYQVHDYAPIDMSHDMFSPGSVYPGYAEDWFGRCYYSKATFSGVPHRGDPANCSEYLNLRERYRLNWADRNNLPMYIGEWGATSRLNGYLQYITDRAELYRDWGINHANYTWKHETIKTGGFYQWGIYSAPHRLDDPARLKAVSIAWAGAVKPNFGK